MTKTPNTDRTTGNPAAPDGATSHGAAPSSGRTADSGQGVHRPRVRRTGASVLRFIPPVAALGTAFVLQVIVVTDTVGGALADRYGGQWPYIVGGMLGLSVASCAEGGAAYLMDLYDRHLLARDSVWKLRIAMSAYVAVSALAIHWWTDKQHLPSVIAWLLAGMSASALFLWSQGSRWRNRQDMIAAGQLDPALPRLPVPAKVWHPIRWLTTLYLISWNPVATTSEARSRYQEWKDRRSGKTARTEVYVQELLSAAQTDIAAMRAAVQAELDAVRVQAEAAAADVVSAARAEAVQVRDELNAALSALSADAARDRDEAVQLRVQADTTLAEAKRTADRVIAEARRTAEAVQPDSGGVQRRTASVIPINGQRRTGVEPTIEQMADTLGEVHGKAYVGKPSALDTLKKVYGSCSGSRAIEAKNLHNARRESAGADSSDDKERSA